MNIGPDAQNVSSAPAFDDSTAHLRAELRKLDVLIAQRVAVHRRRRGAPEAMPATRGVFISDHEVDTLLASSSASSFASPDEEGVREITSREREIQDKVIGSADSGRFLSLPALVDRFALSPVEQQTIVICLAPELDRKYDRLYAYLQQDVTRRKPSIDLVLDLVCGDDQEQRWSLRPTFSEHSPLIRSGILASSDDPASPAGSSGLARFLRLSDRVLRFLLGNMELDTTLDGLAQIRYSATPLDQVLVEETTKTTVQRIVGHYLTDQRSDWSRLVLALRGPYGVGKGELALAVCHELGCPMLSVDIGLAHARGLDLGQVLQSTYRESFNKRRSTSTASTAREKDTADTWLSQAARFMDEYGWLTFLAEETSDRPRRILGTTPLESIDLETPSLSLQEAAWQRAWGVRGLEVDPTWAGELASRFSLTPRQIEDATAAAVHRAVVDGDATHLSLPHLEAASRQQARHNLATLATHIEPRNGWDAIVLPADTKTQLREICAHVKHRGRVLDDWQFKRRLTYGTGLSALFVGPSGTGKTLAAEVIAHQLGLELYKIDLASVVSKYIALHAAFLAADADSEITVDHVLQSARREFEKVGKVWSEEP